MATFVKIPGSDNPRIPVDQIRYRNHPSDPAKAIVEYTEVSGQRVIEEVNFSPAQIDNALTNAGHTVLG